MGNSNDNTMQNNTLIIATRKSRLALWQANWVKQELAKHYPDLHVDLLPLSTQGDLILDQSLQKIGGKGLFTKELEVALLEGRADIAVHSMKDVPMDLPEGLAIPAICERHSPIDVLLSTRYQSLDALPKNAIVGTSSLRRESQLLHHRPDLVIKSLRGNIDTRIKKLLAEEFDAIVLAKAGIERLQAGLDIAVPLSLAHMLPAAGQGALGIECRYNNEKIITRIQKLNHTITSRCVAAERAMVRYLQGGCQVPIAAFCLENQGVLYLQGLVARHDGKVIIKKEARGNAPDDVGIAVAKALVADGGDAILQHYR